MIVMPKYQVDGFINSVSEDEVVAALNSLEASSTYVTKPAYRGNVEKWPDHQISFIDFHLGYLKDHPTLNPHQYLANLRLMLKKNS